MQHPHPEASLNEILITAALNQRISRTPDWQTEAEAMRLLTQELANSSENLLQSLVNTAVNLCQAGTAGVSLLENTKGETVFCWTVLAGALTQAVGVTTPRNFSPCGVCLDRGTPQLYERPARYFTYLQSADPPIVEGLVLPLIASGQALGTIWIVSHDDQRQFDAEDVRVMTSLANFTATALLLQRQTQTLQTENKRLEAVAAQEQQAVEALHEKTTLLERAERVGKLGHWTYDLRTQQMFWSMQARQIYVGDAEFELSYENAARLVHPEDLPGLLAAMEVAIAQRQPLEAEYRIIRPDGEERTVFLNADPDIDAAGQPIKLFGIVQDVTEAKRRETDRQQTEIALRESEARFRILGESLPIIVSLARPDGQIEYINPYWAQFSGRTAEDFITGDWLTAVHPDDQSMMLKRWQQAVAQGTPYEYEFRARSVDGSYRWLLARGLPVYQNGEITHWVNSAIDIHDRKQTEAALRESEELLQRVIENLPGGAAFVVDQNLRYLLAEGEALAVAGFQSADLVGKTTAEVMPPEIEQDYESRYRSALAGEPFEHEHNINSRTYLSRGTPLRNAAGEIYAVLAVSYDITKRKQAEADLAYSRRQFEKIAATTPDLVYVFDLVEERNLYVNAGIQQVLGYSQAQIASLGSAMIGSLIHPDDIPDVIAGNRRFQDLDDQQVYDHELRMRHASGEYRWLRCRDAVFERSADGAVTQIIGTAQDITEQKRAEAALRESEAKYRSLFNSIDEGYLLCEVIFDENDQPMDILYLEANPAAIRLAGRDFSGRRMREIDPNYEDYWYDLIGRVALTGESVHAEHYAQPHGRWFDFYASRVGGPESRRVASIFQDTTDRKQQEQRQAFLLQLSDMLRAEPDANSIASRAVQMVAEHLRLDRAWISEVFEQQGISTVGPEYHRSDLPPMSGVFRLSDYPVTMQQLLTQPMVIQDVTHEPGFSDSEKALLAQLHLRALLVVPLREGQHQVIWAMAAAMDTPRHWNESERALLEEVGERVWAAIERARAEADLRESEEKFRTLFNSLDEGVSTFEVVFDENGEPIDLIFIENNPAFTAVTGLSADVIGKRTSEVVPNLEPFWIETYGRVVKTGISERFESSNVDTDGNWYDVYASRVGGGDSRRVVIVYNNITERKERERQQEFLLKLSDALRAETNADDVANRALGMLLEQMGLDRCYVGVYRLEEDRADLTPQVGNEQVPPLPERIRLSDFPEAFQVTFDQTLVIEDIAETEGLSDTDRQNMAALGFGALVAATLRKGENKPLWAIVAVAASPRCWTRGEIALVEEVAERTWAAVERVRAEAALRESEQRLSVIFSQVAVGLSEISLEGQYLKVNDAQCRMLGQSSDAILNSTIADITHEDDKPRVMSAIEQVIATGESISLDKRYIRADGSTLWASNIFTSLKDEQGNPRSILSVTVDLTERLEAEINHLRLIRAQADREQERQRAENLAELDRAKTAFFSNISHEFRTPLTLILGPLEEALARVEEWEGGGVEGWRSEASSDSSPASPSPSSPFHSLQQNLHLAHRNSLRLLKLVNTLLDFSRIEADRLEANYQATDLSTYTAELASVFRSTIETAGLQLIVDCPPLPEPIYVDREMWEKIVLNLISNAFKFTFAGEIRVSLHWVEGEQVGEGVNAQPNDEQSSHSADAPTPTPPPPPPPLPHPTPPHITLQITDTGIGIPESDLPHLFERFYQVKGARGRSYEGSGIGLSLVQELVKRQGGTISVTSTVNQGSCFTVSIPAGTAHLPPDQVEVAVTPKAAPLTPQAFVEEAERWQSQTPEMQVELSQIGPVVSDAPDHLVSAPEILLADDNADMCNYIQRLLSNHYRIRIVATGRAALSAIQQSLPDLVLTDVMMPEMDGFELLRILRADPRTQQLPVILLSARAGEAAKLAGLQTGADDYLIKPFSARELLTRIDATLKLTQMRREAAQREQQMRTVQQLNEQLEQQVSARTAQLAAVNQELEAFASAIAHDLRVPLNYIKTFTRRLREQLDPRLLRESSLQTFNIVEQAATQSETMVLNLLEFSRLGRTTMRETAVNLNELVETVLNQLQVELAERTVYWQIEPLPVVTGDPVLLQIVVQNLLSNAVKYTRQRAEARITIGSLEQTQEVVVFVQDNGTGFDMRYRDRLFSVFQRLHTQEEFAGTGVGLATVRRIVHRHGGRTWAEGAVDQGATFYFSLPKREVSV